MNKKVFKYVINDKVWLRRKTFGRNENRKMSPRKSGPWTVVKVYANGVNFKIADSLGKTQVVHHNRLYPVNTEIKQDNAPDIILSDSDESASTNDVATDREIENIQYESPYLSSEDDTIEDEPLERRYPLRNREPRVIPGAIPWQALDP